MNIRSLFVFAAFFAAALVAVSGAFAQPDGGIAERDTEAYSFCRPDMQCHGELEIHSTASGGSCHLSDNHSHRKENNVKPGLHSGAESAHKIRRPGISGPADFTLSPVGHNSGSGLLYCQGRLNI